MIRYKSKSNIYRIVAEPSSIDKIKISSSHDTVEYAREFWDSDIEVFESFFIILLNRANNTIGYQKISQGGTDGTVVDIKLIAKYAIDVLASSVILLHNHPSGNLNVSNDDRTITLKSKQGLALLDIQVLDHIILTKESYYSFADEGII